MVRFLFFVMLALPVSLFSQYLSKLKATKTDALFTTYAAPVSRSEYKLDQGYQFQWYDPENGVEMVSEVGLNVGVAFMAGNKLRFRLKELYREPVVSVSYSDLVRYVYYPFPELRVEVTFVVYSSRCSFAVYRLTNTGSTIFESRVLPYFYMPSRDSMQDIIPAVIAGAYEFTLNFQRDGWMREHNIPLTEITDGFFQSSLRFDSVNAFLMTPYSNMGSDKKDPYIQLKRSFAALKHGKCIKGIIGSRMMRLEPGESTGFRVATSLTGEKSLWKEMVAIEGEIMGVDCEKLIREDEAAYARIPKLKFEDPDKEMLYWSSFSLMRQCMMPPEGACRQNYYVFSREPRWGWGYGGQVFHESLCMLAYAYMDPGGAMNSQRVYMDRQQKDGYINYRTGPYLDESIETNGKKTTSAPWFNYENLEIYKITGEKQFLKDAYLSGKKFYKYYIASRDSNSNGLCEWGAHAELESVRDARVAVWDKVGWASNFEGPDVNSMLVREARSLQEMALLLGNTGDANVWKADADSRTKLINDILWDNETGFYYNVNARNQSFGFRAQNDLKIREIIGFLPLWAGVTDSTRTRQLVMKMCDTAEFWRPFGVPSLSAESEYYCPIGYWNGPVWVQWNYLLFRGLIDFGYEKEARELSGRVLANMVYHLKKDHVFWEFYSADDHQAGWNKTYIWAGIGARFLIDLNTLPKRVL